MPTRYYLSLPNPATARGSDADLAFQAHGADAIAQELQDALRSDVLFQRWRAKQDDPDAIDASLGAIDPAATVAGKQHELRVDLIATTSLPGSVFKQRLRLMAGNGWTMSDVTAA
jgi:hypothetical protein